ncbi:hypothetical protein BKA93DRAFT_591450 [Sparassis latifolia]
MANVQRQRARMRSPRQLSSGRSPDASSSDSSPVRASSTVSSFWPFPCRSLSASLADTRPLIGLPLFILPRRFTLIHPAYVLGRPPCILSPAAFLVRLSFPVLRLSFPDFHPNTAAILHFRPELSVRPLHHPLHGPVLSHRVFHYSNFTRVHLGSPKRDHPRKCQYVRLPGLGGLLGIRVGANLGALDSTKLWLVHPTFGLRHNVSLVPLRARSRSASPFCLSQLRFILSSRAKALLERVVRVLRTPDASLLSRRACTSFGGIYACGERPLCIRRRLYPCSAPFFFRARLRVRSRFPFQIFNQSTVVLTIRFIYVRLGRPVPSLDPRLNPGGCLLRRGVRLPSPRGCLLRLWGCLPRRGARLLCLRGYLLRRRARLLFLRGYLLHRRARLLFLRGDLRHR